MPRAGRRGGALTSHRPRRMDGAGAGRLAAGKTLFSFVVNVSNA
ncbi:uncharacterized protein BCN122_II2312 [Burkholderia cenocepacia]|nr:uncharacterized protein BCN122_II2312 [Burkholderia cenocepacia]